MSDDLSRMLEARFSALESRIDTVESVKPKTNWMVAASSAVAILISISTGALTLYDRLVTKPEDVREKLLAEFEAELADVNTIRAQAALEMARASSPEQSATISSIQSGRVGLGVTRLERLEPRIAEYLQASTYYVLGDLNFTVFDYLDARRYFQLGLERNPTELERGRLHRYLGLLESQLDGADGDTRSAAHLAEALKAFERSNDASVPMLIAETRLDMIALTVSDTGACETLPALFDDFSRAVSKPSIQPQHRLGYAQRINYLATTPGQRCTVPPQYLNAAAVPATSAKLSAEPNLAADRP